MAINNDMDLSDLIWEAYTKGTPPSKLLKLVGSWLEDRHLSDDEAQEALSSAMVTNLLRPHLPPLIINYLSKSLDGLTTSLQIFISLLPRIQDNHHDRLNAIFSVLLSSPASFQSTTPIPYTLPLPHPEIGTSTPTLTSTLSLLLPLIRIASQSLNSPTATILEKVLKMLPPYPAPPFEVGFEAGQLLGVLPESLAGPLRVCLSGLMADLGGVGTGGGVGVGVSASGGGVRQGVPMIGGTQEDVVMKPSTALLNTSGNESPPLPLPQTISFILTLLSYQHDTTPEKTYQQLIQLGPRLSTDPDSYLSNLVEASTKLLVGCRDLFRRETVDRYWFVVDGLPRLLAWWKNKVDDQWAYPGSLATVLTTIFQSMDDGITQFSNLVTSTYTGLIASTEMEEEGSYTQPEGWTMNNLQETLIKRLIQLGLLTPQDGQTILPGVDLTPELNGLSLIDRLSNAPKSHLAPLALFIVYTPSAARTLASELMVTLKTTPPNPPENLYTSLSSQPILFSTLTSLSNPREVLALLDETLLEILEDAVVRAEDPQGSLTRFGEGVVLVEAFVEYFELELPDLLDSSRRVFQFTDLNEDQKPLMNGWIKALFGPDGIEDEILLVTSFQTFCRLASSCIHQSIIAASVGQIDLDTLHSGLSYFSQPLLSWCLGGVVGWLCGEIQRQGLLSALHLDVLQTLVLSSSFPEALLRVNARCLEAILDPRSGLGPVLQSSGFDSQSLRTKLDSIGVNQSLDQSLTPPLYQLRANLQPIRNHSMMLPGWENPLVGSLKDCLRLYEPSEVVVAMITEILVPSFTLDTSLGDPLIPFVALLTVLPINNRQDLIKDLIQVVFPSLFDKTTIFEPSIKPRSIGHTVSQVISLSIKFAQVSGLRITDLLETVKKEMEYQKTSLQPPYPSTKPEVGTKRKRLEVDVGSVRCWEIWAGARGVWKDDEVMSVVLGG